jgi:hypothetical protein
LIFYQIPDEMIERAKEILMVLEMTNFQWTIEDVLEQPEQELRAVMHLKATGEKMRTQLNNQERAKNGNVETI